MGIGRGNLANTRKGESILSEEIKKSTVVNNSKKAEMVKIKILKRDTDDTNIIPVGINGKFYYVPVGIETEVPKNVKRLLEKGKYI